MARLSKTGSTASKSKARNASQTKGRKTAKNKRRAAPATKPRKRRSISELEAQLQRRTIELNEALELQTATADVLKVIASSPADVQPVFDAIAERARVLCGASLGFTTQFDGELLHLIGFHGTTPGAEATMRAAFPVRPDANSINGRCLLAGAPVQIDDVQQDPAYQLKGVAQAGEYRSLLAIPLLQGNRTIGVIGVGRQDAGEFPQKMIELLQSFADQTVIAIQNARLFNETKEVLEQQTATADILKVIASSPDDVQPVFEAIAERSKRLVGALSTTVFRLEDGLMHLKAYTPTNPEADATLKAGFPAPLANFSWGPAISHGDVHRVLDTEQEVEYLRELARLRGFRSMLFVPLLRDGTPLGVIAVTRVEPGPFLEHHVQLLQTFADQAVIAIQNARLFNDLRESLEQQTATSEILRAISQSPTDVQPVLDTVAKAAVRFCGAADVMIQMRDGDGLMPVVHEGALTAPIGIRRSLDRSSAGGRAVVDARTFHIADISMLDPIEYGTLIRLGRENGVRAIIAAPMLRDGVAVGSIVLRKSEVGEFTPRQIGLLETFAAQAVIAIENVRLFTELRDSLERLKAAQANLVQSEKMASLGQLTAGIAHENKNPLNFVNNFATLSVDLLDEIREVGRPAFEALDEDKRAELDETIELLTSNLSKIAEHGRRADGIVKSMLSHSRGGTGDWQPSDINGLVEEALNLAYHGARAHDQEFNVTLERDFDKTGGPIDVVPQDVTRVFLNLFGNGFYAANKRRLGANEPGFKPTITVSTRDMNDVVEIRVRDNGTGIPPEVRAKLFQPFFTTKPTGEGTGLGLSISYDIVTQQHGGTIEVESEPGSFTEFTVRLPRRRRTA